MDRGEVRTVWWKPYVLCLIDQTKLPHTRAVVRCTTVAEVAGAIRRMVVRGAPAIGDTAAYRVALATLQGAFSEVRLSADAAGSDFLASVGNLFACTSLQDVSWLATASTQKGDSLRR